MIVFLALLGTLLCGLAGLGPWVIAIAAVSIMASYRAVFSKLYQSPKDTPEKVMQVRVTTFMTVVNAIVGPSVAYGAGLALKMILAG